MYKQIALALVLGLACSGAFAASFDEWNDDGDSSISRDEFYGSAADLGTYSDWDLNDDGLIDEDEWNEIGWDYDYGAWDVDDDGYLDSGEFYDGIYGAYDANDDGEWSNGEWDDFGDAGLFDT